MGNVDQSKTCILITSSGILNLDNNKEFLPRIVTMRHPRSSKPASFLLKENNSAVEEIFLFSEKRSLFIDNAVIDEAQIYFSTPVDSLFLILPYLLKIYQEKKVVPIEDLLVDDIYPEISLLKSSVLKNIHLIADKKGPEDLHAWTYNEEKTMEWLKRKTEKVAQFFKSKKNYIKKGATSTNFVKSLRNISNSIDHEMNKKYAYELVSEYLTEEVSDKLLSNLGLPAENLKETISEKRKLNQVDEGERQEINKKAKKSSEINNLSKDTKSKSKSIKEKSTKKCEKGSQQIINFFKRK